jgi:bifunctional UDP-N-acetylglucosamine pyrophosphorylase/glucosamine-1-phosphate N-acetyltransferase
MNSGERDDRVDAVILAAGKGTRMKSDLPKVLHELAGKPLVEHVLAAVRAAGIDRTVVVVGHQAERVRRTCRGDDLVFVDQRPQLGTGHAVMIAEPELRPGGLTLILAGDVPLLRPETLRGLVARTASNDVAASVLTCVVPDAGAYGRIVKDAAGRVLRIVEARDASPEERAIREFNTGLFCFRTNRLREALATLTTDNDQGEYYLTDTVAALAGRGLRVAAVVADDPSEVVGVNTVAELAEAETIWRRRST